MTKLEDYTARAAESLAAHDAAGTARDRAHHHRAHSIWRRLIANLAIDEERSAMAPAPRIKPEKPVVASKAATAGARLFAR
jgi:hypothetical protein